MRVINGYVARRSVVKSHNSRRKGKGYNHTRNWFFVKYASKSDTGYLDLPNRNLNFPKEYVGKRVRLKVEICQEND